jgi:uncharacterized Ntn-hydrolase superfamily protein
MTYSIVAHDPHSGELGIAVQSRYFAAGRVVPWIESGVGAVATQAFANPMYGHEGLRLMRAGMAPDAILRQLLDRDDGAARRQVAMVDVHGRIAVHTGAGCVAAAGHAVGEYCTAQGNMLASAAVWPAMVEAFEGTQAALADRLLAAMDAAERAGGDLRGRQAAALLVAAGDPSGVPRLDLRVDVRVDDHPEPVNEVRRLVHFARANELANRAIEKILSNDLDAALRDLDACLAGHPREPVFNFRRALALLQLGRSDEAAAALRMARSVHPGWGELLLRFADAGIVPHSREALEPIATGHRV